MAFLDRFVPSLNHEQNSGAYRFIRRNGQSKKQGCTVCARENDAKTQKCPYLIYGHIHGNYGQLFWPLISSNDHMLNAGVDINGFYPVTFDEVVENNRRFKGETDFLLDVD